jgi:hypothetical protein
MDARLTPEQLALRAAAGRLADDLGPGSVHDLDDADRLARLEKAVDSTGWRALRSDGASAVEVAVVVEEFGRRLVDVPFLGPVLVDDLRRHVDPPQGPAALGVGGTAFDCRGQTQALALAGTRICLGDIGSGMAGADLTRATAALAGDLTPIGEVPPDVAQRWHALALVGTSADLVGTARGALALAVEYAKVRRQYGRMIGSYQGVSHPLAEGLALVEGSVSILRHATWAVDEASPAEAVRAARMAKVYCARAARAVCETAVQVHGGIGNTWECLVHVYLRRALTSADLFPVRLEEIDVGLP